jgi:hypothetical protein
MLFLALVIVAGVFNGCKKDQDKTDQAPTGLKDNEVAEKIRNFKIQGTSGFKNAEEVDIEEALWYITTTANYTYSDLTAENEKTWVDTCLINISLTNSKVSLTEVYAKYELMVENLRSFYAAKSEENKQFLSVSLQPVSMDDNNLVCKASAVFTYSPIPGGSLCNFNSTDHWSFWWFYQGGICDGPNSGTNLESDAAEEIQKRIMRCKGALPSNYYYEPTVTISLNDPLQFPIPFGTGTPHNNGYCYLYWNSSQYLNFEGCLSPYYLNFYLTKTKELIYQDVNNGGIRPVGEALIDINLWGNIDNDPNGYLIYFHQANVNYGILRLRPDPRDILD